MESSEIQEKLSGFDLIVISFILNEGKSEDILR